MKKEKSAAPLPAPKPDSQDRQEEKSERLARFLAHAGVASRRHAEDLMREGCVQVNGVTVTTPGTKIDPRYDRVSVNGKVVQSKSEHVYIVINKPRGYVCTAHDPQGRPTVLDLLPEPVRALRIYPVGRLDIDTSGLLLLTNDGSFALRLTHPRYEQKKHYEAVVQGHPSAEALTALREGITIREDDGRIFRTTPAEVRLVRFLGSNACVTITIHEGHKRQIRRMFAAVGYTVQDLTRVGIGPLALKNIASGSWRYLTSDEVELLSQ